MYQIQVELSLYTALTHDTNVTSVSGLVIVVYF